MRQIEALRQRPVIVAYRTDLSQADVPVGGTNRGYCVSYLFDRRNEQTIVALSSSDCMTRVSAQACFTRVVCPQEIKGTTAMRMMQKEESLISKTKNFFTRVPPNGTTCRKLSHLTFLVLLQIRTLMADEHVGRATGSPEYEQRVSRPTPTASRAR